MAITIISQPSALALSGNLGKVELDTGTFSGQVTFQLCIPGSTPNANPEIITSQIYFPDSIHRIVIDLSRIISEQLSFNFQPADITQPWRQTLLARTFYFTAIENADGAEAVRSDDFICIRAGIDNLQESVAIWLTANFLTWQPTVKRVTYSTPEFLTYYAQDDCTVHVRIYYPDGSDPTDHTLAELTAGAWTIPVSYSVIAALLELTTPQQLAAAEHLPGAYDIWIEDGDSTRLTYIQRYLASALRENEQWVLFENSLGGIDCFRAYGQGSVETEHQHQTAEIDNDTTEYRIDTIRRQKRSTGWLDKAQRRWLLDFFPASRRWLCQDGVFRPIILTDDSVTYALDNMPAEFEFTFRYTTGKPYLNLSRLLTLPSVLDIQAPDMQSFTVPPRLVEFPRIGPSEGALIPAQLPHSDNWAALSLSELIEYINPDITSIWNIIETLVQNKKDKQTAKPDPIVDGESITFIATLTQNANGEITATKKTIRTASAEQSGVVSTGNQEFAGKKTFQDPVIGLKGFAALGIPDLTLPAGIGGGKGTVTKIEVNGVVHEPDPDGVVGLPDYPADHTEEVEALQEDVQDIQTVIPDTASVSNPLVDTASMNDAIEAVEARGLSYNAQGDAFPTKASLTNATTFYYGGSAVTPTNNDIVYVLADEGHDGGTTKYALQNGVWAFRILVNESPMTQEQLNALNSGITEAKRQGYDNPTFTEASALANITSGESASTLWGKVKKAISSLITHIADDVRHITSAERTAWNGKQSAIPTTEDEYGITYQIVAQLAKGFKIQGGQVTAEQISNAISELYNTKQDKIDSSHKLAYSLISGTPTIGNGIIFFTLGTGPSRTDFQMFTLNQTGNKIIGLYRGSHIQIEHTAESGSLSPEGFTISTDIVDADATHKGLVTTDAQTLAGDKTFTGNVTSNKQIVGKQGVAAKGISDLAIPAIKREAQDYKDLIHKTATASGSTYPFALDAEYKRQYLVLTLTQDQTAVTFDTSTPCAEQYILLDNPDDTAKTVSVVSSLEDGLVVGDTAIEVAASESVEVSIITTAADASEYGSYTGKLCVVTSHAIKWD